MKKVIISSVCAMAMLAGSGVVAFAEDSGSLPAIEISVPKVVPVRKALEAVKEVRQSAEEQMKSAASATRAQIEGERKTLKAATEQRMQTLEVQRKALRQDATTTATTKALREQFQATAKQEQEAMKADREDFKKKVETQKEELKTKREQEKEKLKTDVQKIKDTAKQQTVTNLDQRFSDINQKTAAQWTDALTRMGNLLAKISSRSDKAALAGKDVSATTAAIAAAKTAIAAAQTAVTAQTGKTYPIAVPADQAALKSAVAQVRDTLNNDLKAVRTLMQAAQKSVGQAAETLSGIPHVDEDATATSTNQ